MTILNIEKYPAPILSTPCIHVQAFDDNLRQLASDMLETMKANNGVGLAASQVGKNVTMIVVNVPKTTESEHEGKDLILVNPLIVRKQGKKKTIEGCLSFPDIFEPVDRPDRISVNYQDEYGTHKTLEAEGTLSVCIQHEVDHLDGVVFTERMSRLKAKLVKDELRKRQRMGR